MWLCTYEIFTGLVNFHIKGKQNKANQIEKPIMWIKEFFDKESQCPFVFQKKSWLTQVFELPKMQRFENVQTEGKQNLYSIIK